MSRLAPLVAVIVMIGGIISGVGVTHGWRPQDIIAANPTPDLTATAVVVDPVLDQVVERNEQLTMHSLACACDRGLAAVTMGRALRHDRSRLSGLQHLVQHRTTVVRSWRITSTQLIPPDRGKVWLTETLSEWLYQGFVPIRRIDGTYRRLYSLRERGLHWKVGRVQTYTWAHHVTVLTSAPPLNAAAAYIMDDTTGQTLYSWNGQAERYVASTAKMITALVAIQHLPLDSVVTVPAAAMVGGTSANLVVGERIRVRDLFYGMLLPSGNDAATTFAIATAGSIPAFAAMMNAEARRLHMTHSHFVVPHGLDVYGQYSTAHDLALAARALLRQPFLASVVRTREYRARSVDGIYAHDWVTTNHLLGVYPGAIGVKTGTTPLAGANLVASAVRGGHRIIAVVLGDTDAMRFTDATALLNYGWRLLAVR